MSPSLATQCVHTGTIKDERFPGMNTPVYTFTTCEYGTSRDNFYPHYFNIPNHRGSWRKCVLWKAVRTEWMDTMQPPLPERSAPRPK